MQNPGTQVPGFCLLPHLDQDRCPLSRQLSGHKRIWREQGQIDANGPGAAISPAQIAALQNSSLIRFASSQASGDQQPSAKRAYDSVIPLAEPVKAQGRGRFVSD